MKKKDMIKKSTISKDKITGASKNVDLKPLRSRNVGEWEITEYSNAKINSPILIEGMPGIGNVGKVSMDILIEETKANLFMSFHSKDFPNTVFVNEDNLVDLPTIGLYHKNICGQDYLFLTGDAQPVNESASYTFSELILKIFKDYNGKHLVTLGGIGLNMIPESPKVYITGNDKKFVASVMDDFKKKKFVFESKIYGMVGPIMGITGLLLGIAKKYDIKAYCILSETLGHPVYVGLKGSKAIMLILSRQYGFNVNFEKLDKEIKQIDARMLNPDAGKDLTNGKHPDVNYIG